jgi:hypothetical protein
VVGIMGFAIGALCVTVRLVRWNWLGLPAMVIEGAVGVLGVVLVARGIRSAIESSKV